MTIDLKFDVGDTAWIMHENKPLETIVLGFHLDIPIGEQFYRGSTDSGDLAYASFNPSYYINTCDVFLQKAKEKIIRNDGKHTQVKNYVIITTKLELLYKTKQELINSLMDYKEESPLAGFLSSLH